MVSKALAVHRRPLTSFQRRQRRIAINQAGPQPVADKLATAKPGQWVQAATDRHLSGWAKDMVMKTDYGHTFGVRQASTDDGRVVGWEVMHNGEVIDGTKTKTDAMRSAESYATKFAPAAHQTDVVRQ